MSADGTWTTTMNTPMGAQNGTMDLASDGGTLTGTLSGPQGALDIVDGTIDGNDLTFKANVTSPMAITLEFAATIDGDNISGTVKLGAFGNGDFTGTRG